MIAPIPERVLKLVTERDEPKVRTNSDVLPRDGMMRELIAQARRAGYNRDFIVDALDRRIRAYIAKVGNRGEGERNSTAFRIAVWLLNDFGSSDAVALAYLEEWNASNLPPLSDYELRSVLKSAKRSHRRPAGCAHDRGSAA